MSGRRFRYFIVCAVVMGLLFGLDWNAARAAEGQGGRPGLIGSSSGSDEMIFSELAARDAGIRTTQGVRSGQVRRKGSSARPEMRARTGAEDRSAQVFVAASGESGGSEPVFTAASSPPSPPPSASFLALADNAVAFNPDTQGAVGPNHLMVTLGSQVRIQNRSGGVISTVSLDGFWGALGRTNVFDPRVLYDAANQRWITAAISNPATNNASLLVAVSQSNDPTGGWYRHAVRVDLVDGVYASSPNVGLSRDWITIQANMFDQTGLFFFSSDIFVFNKTNLYAGGAAGFSRFYYFPSSAAGTPVPAMNHDSSFGTNYLVADAGVIEGLGRLRLFTITGPVNNPLFNEFGGGLFIAGGPAFGSPTWETTSPFNDNFAPQLGTTNRIFIGDSRIQNVVYRNGLIWATHHVFLPTNAPTRSLVQWWSFTPGGSVLQHGRMDDPTGGKFYAYPSIAVNRYEDVLIGYSRFAANQYPSANYAFHGFQDGPGKLQADTVLKAGEAKFTVQDHELILWGDWSGTVVDPVNDVDMWTIQEYAAAPVSNIERWGTWWGRVSPPTSLSLNATDSPDPLIAGSSVTYSIQITNTLSQIATGVRLVSTLPAGAGFVSANLSQGSCSHSNGVVTCDVGDMPGVVGSTVVVSGTIVAVLNQGGTATNRIVVSSHGPDTSPLDNTRTVLTTVSTASDLSLTLRADPAVVILGDNVTYSMTVTNLGPSSASGVFVTNVLPASVVYVSASTSQGSCSQAGGRVTCNVGTLSLNAGAIITVVVRSTSSGLLTASAAARASTIDPNPANSSASLTTKANSLPTLQSISNRIINEDTVLGPVAFTIGDAETAPDNLLLNAFSSNPAIVPAGNIVFGGIGANRTMTITPALDANGAVTITRTLTDSDGSIVSNSFVLTITAVNDPPFVSNIPAQSMNEDTVLGPLNFFVGDAETSPAQLSLSRASSNPVLIPNANILLGGSGANRTLTIIPTTNLSGSASITLTVSDGITSVSAAFVVTVNAVNDAPTITDLPNRVINEDGSTPVVSLVVGDVETPAASLTVAGTSSNTALIPNGNIVLGGSGANRTVVVTPAPNQFGAATITLTVNDGTGGTASDTFVVTVMPVNDPPTMSAFSPRTMLEDAIVQTVSFAGVSAGANNEVQTITITATSSNPGLIPNPITVSYNSPASMGSLSFQPVANASGVASITVTANDGAPSNNIVTRVFTVTVTAVNDTPTISTIANTTIDEDTSTGSIPFTIGDVESSAPSLVISGGSSNPALVPVGNMVFGGSGSNRTVTVTPLPDKFGLTTVSIFVSDGDVTGTNTFLLSVRSVNDLPAIGAIANRTINEDEAANISFTISDLETPAGSLTLNASASNPSLFSSFSFDGTGGNRTVIIVPATNQSGSATVTITVIDVDGGSNSTAFALSVLPVNDPPTVSAIADVSIAEDAPSQSISLSGITSGAPDENQVLTVSALSNGSNIVRNVAVTYVSPDATGILQFELVPDANGTAVISVLVSDGITTSSRTFNVIVSPVNDAPSISPISNIEIDEDVAATIPFVIDDLETPVDLLTVHAVSSNPELLDETGISFSGTGADRAIILTPLLDQSDASTVITITVTDGDNDVSVTSFELSVRPINDAPVISLISDFTILEDTSSDVISFTVSDAESFPSSLIVTAASSNPALVPDGNIILGDEGFNRTVRLLPLAHEFGSSIISVFARDGTGEGANITTNTFLVTVSSVNDAPTLDPIGSLAVPDDSGMQSINLTGIGTGASNELQQLTIVATSSDQGVIPDPVVDYSSPAGTGFLSFTPTPGRVGLVQITVTVTDDGGVLNDGIDRFSRTFSVQVGDLGPVLLIEQIGGRAVISWSTNSSMNWRLETTTTVAQSPTWSSVHAEPVIFNGRNVVTNSLDDTGRFYRLRLATDPGPALFIEFLSGQAVISWSTNSALNWTLESTADMSVPSSWTAVGESPVILGGRHTLTNSMNGAARFFRLRNP